MSALNAPLVLIPQHFGSLVFDRSTSRYLPFDAPTTALLQRLKKERPEVVARSVDDIEAFIDLHESLFLRGFCTPDGRFAGETLPIHPPAHHLTGPLAVHLEVAGSCNLTCTHCFAGALPKKEPRLTLAEMSTLFDQLGELGSYRLGLTGGEPLMRKDILDILDEAHHHGLHPCLTTNGLMLDETLARELGQRDFAWLNVSLEGATPATNDAIRGAGVFDAVRDKLRLLARHARFTLAFTITSTNAHEVEACARLAHDVGAHTAVFRPLYPTGVAREHPELMPSYETYSQALRRLEGITRVPGHEVCGIDPLSDAQTATHPGCGAGTTVCSISLSGQVNPCSFLGPEHNAGSLREHTFREIWNHSQVLSAMRDPALDTEGFSGGCRARSQAAHGSIRAPDPWMEAHLEQASAPHPKTNLHLTGQP